MLLPVAHKASLGAAGVLLEQALRAKDLMEQAARQESRRAAEQLCELDQLRRENQALAIDKAQVRWIFRRFGCRLCRSHHHQRRLMVKGLCIPVHLLNDTALKGVDV